MTERLENVTVVVPTIGRPSLDVLLQSLGTATGLHGLVVVDDRPAGRELSLPDRLGSTPVRLYRSFGRGPAAARNVGWRHAETSWIAYLDDDVVVSHDWATCLAQDLERAEHPVAGVQGQVDVPLPVDRRPTDWERSTAGLATSRWITADMAYRRQVLELVGGFDERFTRAFREDADLALRVQRAGFRLSVGQRRVTHPVRSADAWVSVRAQAGNADDALMRRLHGPRWRQQAEAPRGRRRRHCAVTAAGLAAGVGLVSDRRGLSLAAGAVWLAGTAELASARIVPGPRSRAEVARMVVTSLALPPTAVAYWVIGSVRHRKARPWRGRPDAVLFDRDGTLVTDVPYNGDPALVRPVPGARRSLDRLRAAGLPVGVVSNQSGIGQGLLTSADVEAVNRAVDELLGPFDVWQVCPHHPLDGCECRKPAPGLVERACRELGVQPARTVVVGDIGSDVEAARSAGALAILVPNDNTQAAEVRRAEATAQDLSSAVDLILDGAW